MASKSFQVSIDFIGNISDLQSKIKQVTGEISKIGATTGGAQVQKQFEQLVKTVTDLQTRASQPIGSKAEFNKLAGEVSKANMTYGQLMGTIERLQSLGGAKLLEFLPKDQQNNIKQATQAVNEFIEAKEKAEKNQGKNAAYSKLAGETKFAQQEVERLKKKLDEVNAAKDKVFGSKASSGKTAKATRDEYNQLYEQVRALERQRTELGTSKGLKEAVAAAPQGSEARAQAEAALTKYKELSNEISKINSQLNQSTGGQLIKNAEAAQKEYNKAAKEAAVLSEQLKNTKIPEDGTEKLKAAFEQLVAKAAQLGVQVSDIGSVDNVQTLLNRLNQLESDGFIEGAQAAQQYANTIRSILDPAFKQMETGMNGVNQTWGQFMTAQEDMSMLQNRLKYFFSLTNSIQLLKRTITSAMNTVKELDAVMTETAVVTDFTVGDMWDKLPKYANQASALGASIKDLYSATTLYYQQGLNSAQAMSVGIETMKMARIAGMEAADATQAMTAALRGFNMEINEVSATRVNDVYSKLAAITAADTEQIATAMSKTASIAASANMEFETTSALLAQIIETTQEAPETAGTAMKTIIARFTEVKKLFGEGVLSGEDEEGEVIEINKIDAALRTVGISLTDFLRGEKGIDDIFLELASKWNTLDLATQRYIATTAAGSRQQSRFIAMMSNYDRTMELVTAANNSAGASQEQFDKTLDSMEAKLQKLKNAWAEFTMGIANNEILKGGIDLLTKLLETVNKLTTALSGNSGMGKGILNLMTVIGALSGGKMLLQKGFGTIGTWMGVNQGTGQPQKITAWQRAKEYSKSGQSAKQKVGYYATGLFAEKQDRKFQETLDKKQMLASRQEQLDKLRNMNRRTSGIGAEKLGAHYNSLEVKINGAEKAVGELKGIQQEFEKTGQVSAKSAKVLEQYGLTAQDVANSVYPLRINLQAAGAAAMLAGGAFGLLANALEKNGMDEAAEVCRTLSTAMIGLGGVLMMLPMVLGGTSISLKGFKLTVLDAAGAGVVFQAAFWQIALVAAIVVGVIWGLVAAFQAIHDSSPKGKLKAATEAAKDAEEAAENAAQAYEHLASALDSIEEKENTFEKLTIGTTEWKKAVQELNGEILNLIEQYPELAQFVRSENGVLTISKDPNSKGETADDILNKYQNASILAQSAKAAANIQKQYAQSLIDYQETIGEIFAYKDAEVQKGEWKRTSEGPDGMSWVPEVDSEGNAITETVTQQTFLGKNLTDEIAKAIVTGTADFEENEDDEIITVNLEGKIYSFTTEDFGELKEYGNTLIAAEAATEAYAQAILANAAAIADVPENVRKDVDDFWSPGQVKNMTDSKKEEILKGGIDDSELEEYAKIMGYTQVGKNLYKGEALSANKVDYDEESVATQLAAMRVSKDLSNFMENNSRYISTMQNDELAIAKAISTLSLDNLTLDQLGQINTDEVIDMVSNLGYVEDNKIRADTYAEEHGYEPVMASTLSEAEIENLKKAYMAFNPKATSDDAQAWIQNQIDTNAQIHGEFSWMADIIKLQEEAQKAKTQITGKLDNIMDGDESWTETNLAQASYSTLNGLETQASQMAPEAAKEYIEAFANTIAKNPELSQDTQQALSNYLSNVDWPDMAQAVNAMDYMQQMGMDPSVIKKFWDTATASANTYMSSISQVLALTEKFQGKIKQVDEIEEALEGGKATNEQMQQLINAGVDVGGFELTADGWKATKEQIDEATQKLREYNAEQARATANQQAKEFKEAKDKIGDFGITYDKENGRYSYNKNILEQKGITGAYSVNEEGKLVAGTVTTGNTDGLATLLGINKDNYKDDTEAFHQAIQTALLNYINLLNDGEQIKIMLDKAAALTGAATYTTDENVQRGGSEESVRMSMQQEATDLGLDSEEVTKYADAMLKAYESEGLTAQGAAQLAIDYARMTQGMEEITSKWDEWKEKISIDNEIEKALAFEEIAASANKMLGITGVLDAEFLKLEGSMELVQQAAKGDAEAFNTLQKAAAKNVFKKFLGQSYKVDEALEELIDQVAEAEMKVGEIAKLDISPEEGIQIDTNSIAGKLTSMYNAAYNAVLKGTGDIAAAQQAGNEVIAAAGFETPQMVEKTVTVKAKTPPGVNPVIGGSVTTSDGTVHQGVNWVSEDGSEYSYTTTQLVPENAANGGGYTKAAETIDATGGKSGGGGGGGGGKWENSVDKLYNVQENIDRTIREREQIERRYQRLLDRRLATAQELYQTSQAEIDALREQAEYQKKMVEGRKEMLLEEMEENKDMQKYATIDTETGQITINWDLINSVTDEEEGKRIEEYLAKLEELRDSMRDAEDALEDIEDAIWEIEQRGREEYMEFEERIKEAIVENRQREIDELQEINDSINDTNSKLIDSIQSSIDKMRQDRENEETEEDLQEKQRRLAYLEQDTSGANAMEILDLRKEIREGQRDYTDSLIDQKISELQEQNEEAAEQREQQITIMQNQLDWYVESGRIWAEVEKLMREGMGPDGSLLQGSELMEILKSAESWKSLSEIGQMDWLLDLETLVAQSMGWKMGQGQLENLHEKKTGQTITFTNAKGEVLTGTVDEKGNVVLEDGTYYKDVYQWIDGTYHTTEEEASSKPSDDSGNDNDNGGNDKDNKNNGGSNQSATPKWWQIDSEINHFGAPTKEKGISDMKKVIDNYINKKINEVEALWKSGQGPQDIEYYNSQIKPKVVQLNQLRNTYKAGITATPQYKTGGLADFTGPAWLDGTKTRPELVLNQRDTQNFIQLKDILSSIMSRNFSSTSTSTENNGDIIYDIDINVETISSDYDVEQVASKVKSMIVDNARYRNNNAISLTR